MDIAVYTRVSTEKESQVSSYENQLSYFKNKIEKEGNVLYQFYGDPGLSGVNLKREQFIKMLYDAGIDTLNINTQQVFVLSKRNPKFDIIYTKSTSRLARTTDILNVIKLLKQKGITIYFEDINKSTNDIDAELLINLMILLDAQFSKDLSNKTRFGKRESNKKNLYKMRLLGYDKIDDKVVIIQEEAELVKKIFDMYVNQNLGTHIIAKKINEQGYRSIKGRKFNGTSIYGILHNEKYIGTYVANKRYTDSVNNIHRKNEEKDWIIRENAFEAIINKDLFNKAQEKLSSTAIGNPPTANNRYGTHLKCGICGGNTQIRARKNRSNRYVCSTKRKKGPSVCNGPYVLEETIDKFVNSVLRRIDYWYNGEIFWGIRALEKKKGNLKEDKDIEERRNKLVDLYLDNLIDKKLYEKRIKELDELNKTNEIIDKINNKIQQLKELRDIQLPTTKDELLAISTLYINEDKTISIKFSIREEIENIINS